MILLIPFVGGNRRIKPGNHNDKPLVVVLAGNNRMGAFGLAAARHLANHDCIVKVFLTGSEAELVNASLSATRKSLNDRWLHINARFTCLRVDNSINPPRVCFLNF